MRRDVLFVDDEPSLLIGIQRRLSSSFNVATAISGEAALLAIEERSTPFPVVVTDMRMPEMDGLRFIELARKKSPDTTYIMLTGNQDQVTVTEAVNRGHVYGFLNKPCEGLQLRSAIEQGIRRFDAVVLEKELLEKTFYGAVSVLSDLLELGQPDVFLRSARIEETVMAVLKAARVPTRWEYYVAAKLSLIGVALLEPEQRVQLYEDWGSACIRSSVWERAAEISSRLVERIPRLGLVAEMIGKVATVDGAVPTTEPSGNGEVAQLGAAVLRAAVQWEALRDSHIETAAARKRVQHAMPGIPRAFLDALPEFHGEEKLSGPIEVRVDDLREGMVLKRNITTSDGVVLVGAGRRLTATLVEKLRARASYDTHLRHAGCMVVYGEPLDEDAAAEPAVAV